MSPLKRYQFVDEGGPYLKNIHRTSSSCPWVSPTISNRVPLGTVIRSKFASGTGSQNPAAKPSKCSTTAPAEKASEGYDDGRAPSALPAKTQPLPAVRPLVRPQSVASVPLNNCGSNTRSSPAPPGRKRDWSCLPPLGISGGVSGNLLLDLPPSPGNAKPKPTNPAATQWFTTWRLTLLSSTASKDVASMPPPQQPNRNGNGDRN
mmetsp:Transcript_6068/g.17656  ORF Transcript_6068/g.17656 Transcript_6068/m.17656 type:complete len:205 (+) Transcript_6068:2285-2899(+)